MRGYTLLEVVAVLLVLALAAGVVAPSASRGVDRLRARAAVAGVASFLRSAREQAMTREQPCEVVIDSEAGTLVLRVGSAPRATKTLPPTLRLVVEAAPSPVIAFFPQGRSSGGRLRLIAPGPHVYVITVEPMTGRVATRRADT